MTQYRGIEVPENIEVTLGYKLIWQKGVDMALDAVLTLIEDRHEEVASNCPIFFINEWAEGAQYGREDELEELGSDLLKYKSK